MTLLDIVFKHMRAVVDDLDADLTDLHLIHADEAVDERVDYDSGALANVEHVVDDDWLALQALDVESASATGHYDVVFKDKDVVIR